MSFGFLGSFRQTQWRMFRQFVLNERRVVGARLAYIDAELQRIGEITVFYARRKADVAGVEGAQQTVTQVIERRTGFCVEPENSTLHKLVQAYIAQGGNPCEISLFLKPDRLLWESEFDPDEDPNVDPTIRINDEEVDGALNEQPGFGVAAPESDNRSVGGPDKGGWLRWGRYPFRRIGRIINLSEADQQLAYHVDFARRWANPTIQERRNNLEARIIKLMDYREQLLNEREAVLAQAVGGSVDSIPLSDPRMVQTNLSVPKIVETVDNILYKKIARGRTRKELAAQQVQEIRGRPGARVDPELIEAELKAFFQAQESGVKEDTSQGLPDEELVPDLNSVNLEDMGKLDSAWIDDADDDRWTGL